MSKPYGMDDIRNWANDKPMKTTKSIKPAKAKATKPTVGSPKSQSKYFPRQKKGNPTIFTKTRDSKGKKANALSAPFYGRPKRS